MNATNAANCCSSTLPNAGIPLSSRPFRTTAPIFSPCASCSTSADAIRSGPLSPPPASRPWQKPHCAANRVLPACIWSILVGGCGARIWCRGPEWTRLRPRFQGGALPVSYPGTLESVNFRGGRKLCQIPRKAEDFGASVSPRNKTKAVSAARKRAAAAKPNSEATQSVVGEHAAPRLTVLTIGHSTRTIEEFLAILAAHGVERLVDVRSIPKSRRVPQFNSDALAASLRGQGIEYLHLKSLGGAETL